MSAAALQFSSHRLAAKDAPWHAKALVGPVRRALAAVARADRGEASEVAEDDDAVLVARCKCGDGSAWAVLVQRYQRLVHAIVRRVGLDEHGAADVFQTVFERLITHLPRITDPSRLHAWVVTTTKREALLQRERSRRGVSMTRADDADDESAQFDFADDSPIAEEALADLQQMNLLRNALDRLDERSRNLMLLLFRDDDEKLSYEEVSRLTGIPVGSIGPTRQRCIEKLRRLMA